MKNLLIVTTLLLTQMIFSQVGIGTNTPTKELDVNGEARIRTVPASLGDDAVVVIDSDGNIKRMPLGTANNVKSEPWENTDGTQASNTSTKINYPNGNVGINVSNPLASLHVTNTSGDVAIILADDVEIGTPSGQDFEIVHTDNTGAIADRRFMIRSDGNVGIGTTSPTVKHEVAGKHQNENVRSSVSSVSEVSTTSTSWVDFPDLTLTVTSADSHLLILCGIPGVNNSSSDHVVSFRILVDNVQVGSEVEHENSSAYVWTSNLHAVAPVASGLHTIKIQWKIQGGIGYVNGNQSSHDLTRTLSVVEL